MVCDRARKVSSHTTFNSQLLYIFFLQFPHTRSVTLKLDFSCPDSKLFEQAGVGIGVIAMTEAPGEPFTMTAIQQFEQFEGGCYLRIQPLNKQNQIALRVKEKNAGHLKASQAFEGLFPSAG